MRHDLGKQSGEGVLGRGPHAQSWGARDLWVKPLADLRAGQACPGRPSRCQEQSGRGGLEKGQGPPHHVAYVGLLWLL